MGKGKLTLLGYRMSPCSFQRLRAYRISGDPWQDGSLTRARSAKTQPNQNAVFEKRYFQEINGVGHLLSADCPRPGAVSGDYSTPRSRHRETRSVAHGGCFEAGEKCTGGLDLQPGSTSDARNDLDAWSVQ